MVEHDVRIAAAGGRDPVCGRRLTDRQAIRYTHGRVVFLFCGADCLDVFRRHPELCRDR